MKNNIFALNEDFFDNNDINVNVQDNIGSAVAEASGGNVFGIYTESDFSPAVWKANEGELDFKIILKRFVGILSERIRIFNLTGPVTVDFIFNPKAVPTLGSYIEHNMEIPEQKYTHRVDFRDSNAAFNANIYANVIDGLQEKPYWENANEDMTLGCTLGILFKIPCEFKPECSIEKFIDNMIIVFYNIRKIQTYLRTMCSPSARRSNDTDIYFYYKDGDNIISSISKRYTLNGGHFYKDLYKKLYDPSKEEYTDEEKKHLRKMATINSLDNIYYVWHKIYFNKRTRDEFDYTPVGYSTGSNAEYKFYAMLNEKDSSKWTYENINDWFIETFVNMCSKTDKINACHGYSSTSISLFISVDKKNLPVRSDKKKKYIFDYCEKVGGCTIHWKLSYTDGNFVQVNHVSRAFISDNMIDAGVAFSEYKDDLKDGAFGKSALKYMPDNFNK